MKRYSDEFKEQAIGRAREASRIGKCYRARGARPRCAPEHEIGPGRRNAPQEVSGVITGNDLDARVGPRRWFDVAGSTVLGGHEYEISLDARGDEVRQWWP